MKRSQMRLLIVDPSLFTAPYDRGLARALRRRGAQVRLVGRALRPGETTFTNEEFTFDPYFYRLTEGRAAFLSRRLRAVLKGIEHMAGTLRLNRNLQRDSVDVVHFQWLPVPWWDSLFVRRLRDLAPVVVTVHDTQPFQGAPSSRLQRGSRSAWKCADALVVHTEAGADRLRSAGCDGARIAVIPHPPLPLPASITPTRFRPPVRTVVLVGELKPYKGLDVLIEAVGLLGTSSNQSFIIAGRPRMDLDALRRRADSLGVGDRFEWLPSRLDDQQLADVLIRADAFVLPYHRADASGVLSLVLALGRPVVASRVGAMAELLDDGVHALLVPPSDAKALAGALSRLSNDGVAAKLAAGSTSALARLGDWEAAADRHLELYGRLIGGSGR